MYKKEIIKSLIDLQNGNKVLAKRLGSIANELVARDLMNVSCRGTLVYYEARDTATFKSEIVFLDEKFRNLDSLLKIIESGRVSRSDQVNEVGDSKVKKERTFNGFLVNTYMDIPAVLSGKSINLHPIDGSYIFVADWKTLVIPDDVIVVGIENSETFRWVTKQKELFENYAKKVTGVRYNRMIFVPRYPQENSSADLRRWLEMNKNYYIHYGDFDLKGIHIFNTEYYKYLGNRSSFLIPDDIEFRLKNKGLRKRYDEQYEFRKITSPIPEVQKLIDMINLYKKGYDQEGYE